jgi:hypothetical protein
MFERTTTECDTFAYADFSGFATERCWISTTTTCAGHDPTKGTITIELPSIFDEGYYQCTARNDWGTARSDVGQVRLICSEIFCSALSIYVSWF